MPGPAHGLGREEAPGSPSGFRPERRDEEGGSQGGQGHPGKALNLHEHQSKELFRAAGIPVPPGEVASTVEEAAQAAARFGYPVVVKAQVLIGGRGKAGGVKVVRGAEDLRRETGRILGMDIRGLTVRRVLITPSADIDRGNNAGRVLDRRNEIPILMGSPAGGTEIKEVARPPPDRILKIRVI